MSLTYTKETLSIDAADDLKNEIAGKTVLITGVTIGGLGYEAAHDIAKYAKILIITGRSVEKLQKAEDKIKSEFKNVTIHKVVADISSFKSVRKAAAEINALGEPIHVLIANAVINPPSYTVTEDGFEAQFSGDHLAHFLLIRSIFPLVLKARSDAFAPRIVCISSNAHGYGSIHLDDLTFKDGKEYSTLAGYANAKSANLLFARELAKRAADKGVLAFAVHPGAIWTNIYDEMSVEKKQELGIFDAEGNMSEMVKGILKQLNQGATAYIVAAFDPRLKDQSGAFLSEDAQVHNEQVAAHASSPENAKRLWEMSEKFVGETFDV